MVCQGLPEVQTPSFTGSLACLLAPKIYIRWMPKTTAKLTKKQEKENQRKERNKRVREAIVEQKTLKEIGLSGMYLARLTRVRYERNPEAFIDFRIYQRGYDKDDSEKEVYHPTKRGIQMTERNFFKLVEGTFFEGLDKLIEKDPRG